MIKRICPVLAGIIMFLAVPALAAPVLAATLEFDNTSYPVTANSTVSVKVNIDTGGEQVLATDIYVLYDSAVIQAQSVTAGTFFPTVTNNITSGRIYIAGMVNDVASAKTGEGTVATIVFKGLAKGTSNLTFDCSGTTGPSKILNNKVEPANIIQCSANGTAQADVDGGGSTVTPSPSQSAATPTAALLPTAAPTAIITAAAPTALPKTGIMDNINQLAIAGTAFVIFGSLVRLLIL